MLRAGELRHLIRIEEPSELQDEFGEPVQGWDLVGKVWAKREDLTGREAFLAQQVKAEVTTRFRIRYLPGLSATMRIDDNGTLYNVESVQDPDGRNRELHIIASRVG